MSVDIQFLRLEHGDGLNLPFYATLGSAGADIEAANDEPITLSSLQRVLIPTGFKMIIPQGYEVQIRPRSGLAFKHGITCLNTPGTIDSDYRGELKVLLVNLSSDDFTIMRAMRIAQMLVATNIQANFSETDIIDETARAEGGFGSTGI